MLNGTRLNIKINKNQRGFLTKNHLTEQVWDVFRYAFC